MPRSRAERGRAGPRRAHDPPEARGRGGGRARAAGPTPRIPRGPEGGIPGRGAGGPEGAREDSGLHIQHGAGAGC